MSAMDRKCCVPCCGKTRLDNVVLHVFPNPDAQPDRFRLWLYAIGGEILALDNKKIFKYRKVCHDHFEVRFYTSSKRLSYNSVPTLNLSGSGLRRPLMDTTNQNVRNIPTKMETSMVSSQDTGLQAPLMDINITHKNVRNTSSDTEKPSTSKDAGLQVPLMDITNKKVRNTSSDTEKPSTSKGLNALKESQTRIFATEASTLYRQIKRLQGTRDKYAAKLKKALNLAQNPIFQRAVSSFTTTALLFVMLQFRECNKNKMGRRFTQKEKIMALSLYKRGLKAYRWLRNIFVLPSPGA